MGNIFDDLYLTWESKATIRIIQLCYPQESKKPNILVE
jgi:hypothetical protein